MAPVVLGTTTSLSLYSVPADVPLSIVTWTNSNSNSLSQYQEYCVSFLFVSQYMCNKQYAYYNYFTSRENIFSFEKLSIGKTILVVKVKEKLLL